MNSTNYPVLMLAILALTGCASQTQQAAEHNQSTEASLAPPHAPLPASGSVPVVPHQNQLVLLASGDPELLANKQLVFDMWRNVLNAGHMEAAGNYLRKDYIEHSAMVPTGLGGFTAYYGARIARVDLVPALIQDPVVTIVAENDYVAVVTVEHYLEPDGSGATYTSSHFDLFRIQDHKIAEHWDSSQIQKGVFPAAANAGGPVPVTGIVGIDQYRLLENASPILANNKRLVFDLWRHASEAGREESALLYLDPIYIQHNPNATTGRAGFMEYFTKRPDTPLEMTYKSPLITIIAEGDLVVQALQGERPDPNTPGKINDIAWFDMFRVQDGRLMEHWDTASKGEVPKIMEESFKQ